MQLDLNLLTALDALLEEGSVGGAADRMHLSAPAMSRTLGRIRRALGDPVLVRSGRTMVPTPRALELRGRVRELLDRATELLSPVGATDPATLTRTFTVQANDGVLVALGAKLLARVQAQAPGVTLVFAIEPALDQSGLRDGRVDLEIGVISAPDPETRVEPLGVDRIVGVVRAGHPLVDGPVTRERYAAARHLLTSRRGRLSGPIDEALAGHGLSRRVVGVAPAFATKLLMLAGSDLVGDAAERLCGDAVRQLGLRMFPVPVELPELAIGQAWHPRYDADGGHAWLRGCVRESFAELCA